MTKATNGDLNKNADMDNNVIWSGHRNESPSQSTMRSAVPARTSTRPIPLPTFEVLESTTFIFDVETTLKGIELLRVKLAKQHA
jgi:hypothetical protein